MGARRKPGKPPPCAADLICPGLGFQVAHEARLQLQPLAAGRERGKASELRAFDDACVRAYWLALLRD